MSNLTSYRARIVEAEGLRIFGEPLGDMRRRLERMIGLRDDEILRMRKPAFGDVRAPRQWNDTAVKAMLELGWIQHPLEPCLFLSARVAIDADSEFEIY